MKNRIYADCVRDIIDSIRDIESFIKDMEFEEFKKDRKTINAVVTSIELIGEASKQVPEAITDLYPGVPWKKMIKAGFFSPIDSLREIV